MPLRAIFYFCNFTLICNSNYSFDMLHYFFWNIDNNAWMRDALDCDDMSHVDMLLSLS